MPILDRLNTLVKFIPVAGCHACLPVGKGSVLRTPLNQAPLNQGTVDNFAYHLGRAGFSGSLNMGQRGLYWIDIGFGVT